MVKYFFVLFCILFSDFTGTKSIQMRNAVHVSDVAPYVCCDSLWLYLCPLNRDLSTPMGGLCLEGQSHPVRRAVVGGFELGSTLGPIFWLQQHRGRITRLHVEHTLWRSPDKQTFAAQLRPNRCTPSIRTRPILNQLVGASVRGYTWRLMIQMPRACLPSIGD